MSIRPLVQAFLTVFPAELPDKTMLATIVLVTRHRRPLWVWVGAVAAFSVHVVVAVAAGRAISLLPETPVQIAVAALFAFGAVMLVRSAREDIAEELAAEEQELASPAGHATDSDEAGQAAGVEGSSTNAGSPARAAALGSFGLILMAEWGDLTQLATASLATRSGSPIATAVGALLALATVAALAAAIGRQLVARVPLARISLVGAAVFASLSAWTVFDLLR